MVRELLEPIVKTCQYFVGQHDEKMMQAVRADLRRSTVAHAGNFLRPEIGSKKDRLYQRMVNKGYLVRTPLGYVLPEFSPRGFERPF